MLYVVESTKPLDRVADDLEQAVTRHKFGILAVQNLKESMAKKGVAEEVEATLVRIMDEAAR